MQTAFAAEGIPDTEIARGFPLPDTVEHHRPLWERAVCHLG
nr:hypothetical protein [Sphingomonas populi]